MVVNGGFFHSLVIPYTNHVDVTDYPKMAGKAVLICRPNSHPFVDRTLSLEHPVKIGRSVARARAAQTNGVFDCKVLSRNHALIWYNNGKFYLQDTKSSNGTFVNNQRLSKSGEESLPREVSSGDIVQFGVDVLENARKVTHGCIVANLKLYLPDGKEAKASPSTGVNSGIGNVFIEDLYQLNQYIQEALQREQMLQTKLASLQQLVLSLRKAADLGWKALIAEDRLLSRVEILENQLQTYAKNIAEDKLRGELRLLQEDKGVYQGLAKDCIQKVLQEKLEAVQKCQTIERALMSAEMECASYKVAVEQDHDELAELALKHTNQILKTVELQKKLQESEEQHKEALTRLEAENEELNNEVKRLLINEVVMHEKIQQLEASGELVGRQLLGIQTQFHNKHSPDINDHLSTLKERNGSTADVICRNNEEELNEENEKEDPSMDTLLSRLSSSIEEQKKSREVYQLIAAQATLLKGEKVEKLEQVSSLEAELGVHVDKLCKYKEENVKLEKSLHSLEEQLKEETLNTTDDTIIEAVKHNGGGDKLSNGTQSPSLNLESLQAQIAEIKEAIKESHSKMEAVEQTIVVLQIDLNNAKKGLSETIKNCLVQEEKLEEAQKSKEQYENYVIALKDQIGMKSLEPSINDSVPEKFETESEKVNKNQEEATILRKQLQEAHQLVKQHKNEAEILKERLRAAFEELEQAKYEAEKKSPDNKALDELADSRIQVSLLKSQVLSLDSQVKTMQLSSSYNRSKEETGEGSQLESDSVTEDIESLVKTMRLRINLLEEDLVLVKQKYIECNSKKTELQKDLENLQRDYDAIIHQPYFVYPHHYLLGILFALLVAMLLSMVLYPSSWSKTLPPPPPRQKNCILVFF